MCCSTDSSVGSMITALQPNSFAICAVLQCECNSFLDLPRVESGFMRTHTYMQLYSFEIFSVPQRKCYSFVVLLRAALGSERTVLQLNGFEICSVPQCQCSSFVIITSPGDKQVYILVLYKVILFWISCLCPLVYLLADFYIIWQSNYLLTLSIPDDGYSMNTWCALNYISSSFFVTQFNHQIQLVSWYVCACTLEQVISCPFVFCRHRKQTPKTTKQDGGYAMKRQRSFSNPACMEQNKNALDYQLNSPLI